MITEQDLREAIAECQGERYPNAQTCIKLAAFYTILNNMTEKPDSYYAGYSGDAGINYHSETDFARAIAGKNPGEIWPVIDELMSVLQAVNPRLYNGVMRKIEY